MESSSRIGNRISRGKRVSSVESKNLRYSSTLLAESELIRSRPSPSERLGNASPILPCTSAGLEGPTLGINSANGGILETRIGGLLPSSRTT